MPLAATSSLAMASSQATSTAASASAAVLPLSSWMASMDGSKRLVGSAWILSSAILTTYSTTKFLKYQGEHETSTHPALKSKGGERTLRQFNSILNSTQKHPEEEHQLRAKKAPRRGRATSLSRATLLTLYRFSGSLLLGLFLHAHFYDLTKLLPRLLQTVRAARLFLLPSLFLFVANYTNSVALERIGISLTYTSKCGIPLVTVLLTLLLDGRSALPSVPTLLSLLPIAAGVGAASWNSPNFEPAGFLAAVASTTSQAGLNVASKRVMRRTGIKGAEAQRAMVLVALGIGLVMALPNLVGGRNAAAADKGDELQSATDAHPPPWLTGLAVLAYHTEYVLSFSFVSLVEPITYGTCDALRRLLIIVVGNRMFGGDRFTNTNLMGIVTALAGALLYSMTSAAGGPSAKPKI